MRSGEGAEVFIMSGVPRNMTTISIWKIEVLISFVERVREQGSEHEGTQVKTRDGSPLLNFAWADCISGQEKNNFFSY